MFDMSWGEVMVIGAVALIVIGPEGPAEGVCGPSAR